MLSLRIVLALLGCVLCGGNAQADITFERIPIESGLPVILLKGEFGSSDNPALLAAEVSASGAKVVTFNSNGGNVAAAIAYGRMIRSLGLSTFQLRSAQCASACTLAFVGGTTRQAEPGSIGVHQSSFSPGHNLDGDAAVAAVQSMTAEIMTYLIEMGVDSRLLQLSLSVPSDDMRYLTASEMTEYKVTSTRPAISESLAKTESEPRLPAETAQTTASPTNEERALAFMTAYHDAWSRSNAEALRFIDDAYADNVEFYGKSLPRSAVTEEKRKFATRWPIRAYSVNGPARVACEQFCTVDGSVDWFARRDVGDRVSSGTAEFSLQWDPRTNKIVSEIGKVAATDKGTTQPVRLISQWQRLNGTCRGSSGDDPATMAACESRETLTEKLKTVGWCYGREGEYGYQMEWHACDLKTEGSQIGAATAHGATDRSWPRPNDFPSTEHFSGKTILPDFKVRDRDFNSFRTRIRDGMRQGPNFAGHFSLVQIGCGTGCSFVIVADNKTGRPARFPRGGEENMYLDLKFSPSSRLVAAQWLDYDRSKCVIEFFDFRRAAWKTVSTFDIGGTETCYESIEDNLAR